MGLGSRATKSSKFNFQRTILELSREAKWWHGPEWLGKTSIIWPSMPPVENHDEREDMERELRVIHLTLRNDNELIQGKWFKFNPDRQKVFPFTELYGEWKKLRRVCATIIRAIFNFKNPRNRRTGLLLNEEMETAQNYLIRIDQKKEETLNSCGK